MWKIGSVFVLAGGNVLYTLEIQTHLITEVILNPVDEVFNVTGQVKFYGVRFPGRKTGICCKSVRNAGTKYIAISKTPERTRSSRRELRIGKIRLILGVKTCDTHQ